MKTQSQALLSAKTVYKETHSMDRERKTLLTFGFVRDYCKANYIDFPPDDIVELFTIWVSFCDKFDRNLTYKDIMIQTKADNKFGVYEQIRRTEGYETWMNPCVTAICQQIIKKGDKQSWTFQIGAKNNIDPRYLVFGIIDNKTAKAKENITDFSIISGGFGLYLNDMGRYCERDDAIGHFEYGHQYKLKQGDIITMILDLTQENGILSFEFHGQLEEDKSNKQTAEEFSNVFHDKLDVDKEWRAAIAIASSSHFVSLLPYDP